MSSIRLLTRMGFATWPPITGVPDIWDVFLNGKFTGNFIDLWPVQGALATVLVWDFSNSPFFGLRPGVYVRPAAQFRYVSGDMVAAAAFH